VIAVSAAMMAESGTPAAGASALLGEDEADSLAVRIQANAAHVAEAECRLLLLVGEFDAGEGVRWYVGLKSMAHWLSWACSMSPGAAREHVRVARALRSMPLTVREFSAGRLSYSKVREMTRVVGLVDEQELIDLARAMTASQLARTVSAFRALDGTRMPQDARREGSWRVRDDGMIELRVLLPAEMGAEIVTALDLAMERDGTEVDEVEAVPPGQGRADVGAPEAPFQPAPLIEQRRADAFVDLARAYLDAGPADHSGDDRHLVLVHATPDMLVDQRQERALESAPGARADELTDQSPDDVPAGTSSALDHDLSAPAEADVEGAGLSADDASAPRDRCGIVGVGPVEPRTVQRLLCTGLLAPLVTDGRGEVLHLGRTRRLASRAQRRALRATQQVCQFPGCHQSRHLDAHHLVPWGQGGGTDIENLVLLCRRHHVLVHEGGLHLRRVGCGAGRAAGGERGGAMLSSRIEVLDGSGRPVQAQWPPTLEMALVAPLEHDPPAETSEADRADQADEAGAPGALWSEGDARIAPTTGGFGFTLQGSVMALAQSPPDDETENGADEHGEEGESDAAPE
jgi:hypothetical protein